MGTPDFVSCAEVLIQNLRRDSLFWISVVKVNVFRATCLLYHKLFHFLFSSICVVSSFTVQPRQPWLEAIRSPCTLMALRYTTPQLPDQVTPHNCHCIDSEHKHIPSDYASYLLTNRFKVSPTSLYTHAYVKVVSGSSEKSTVLFSAVSHSDDVYGG